MAMMEKKSSASDGNGCCPLKKADLKFDAQIYDLAFSIKLTR